MAHLCFRLQEFIDEGVGAVKDYFQNIVFLLMSDVNGRQMITKTSVLGKMALMFRSYNLFCFCGLYM